MKRNVGLVCVALAVSLSLVAAVSLLLRGTPLAYGASIVVDGAADDGYGPALTTDPDDLNATIEGTTSAQWTEVYSLYVANDTQHLYVFVPLPAYDHTESSGSFGLAIATGQYTAAGGTAPGDPWGNAVTFAYTATHANSGTVPITHPYRLIPDVVIRGNIVGRDCCGFSDNGWTELRQWNGSDYSTGGGANWGGLSGGTMKSDRIAFVDGSGVEFSIPFADLGLTYDPGAPVHLQFYATQTDAAKGAYDTVPNDDQSTGLNDPTTQRFLATYALAISQDVFITAPAEDAHFVRPAITVTGYVTPTGGVTLTLSLNNTATFTPTLDGMGRFTQPMTLDAGTNTITATVDGPLGVSQEVRQVTYGPALTLTIPAEGAHVIAPNAISVAGVAQPAEDVTVTVQLDEDPPQDAPVVSTTGAFSTSVKPAASGVHTIVVTATNASGAASEVRHVTYGAAAQDGEVWWGCLGHFTRDDVYREPWGAQPAGSTVTFRLRTCAGDLTGATFHAWPANLDAIHTPMTVSTAVTDPLGVYDYWEVTVTLPITPHVFFYKFEAVDGADADWYIDDVDFDGRNGWGQPYDTDGGGGLAFDLTAYDPAFTTPDWIKHGVIYQIFPDRFRNGAPANDVVSGSHFFYGDASGGITYPSWNSQVIDPRDPASPYNQRWSEDFYGGDLQGVIDRLDYLEGLGVTAIYLNPTFWSPSNHKYDTTDFAQLDPHMGDLDTLDQLITQAAQRDMVVILDGVFNHTSSDSIYFDRYGRHPTVGACEDESSPYRDWYHFTDVTPGTGPCVGSDGTPNAADYESWWGYDTLPVLDSETPEVRAYFWDDAVTETIGGRWVVSGTLGWRLDVGGDVDSGAWHEPGNDYWEGFRQTVKGANADAVIFGEEWGDARSWLLGSEWDSVMNYRFRSALLSFMRDRVYWDNDNNASSSGGTLEPITVSAFDRWLHQIEEDYPPEAWYAMVNLMGSHDTNRVRFVLSKWQLGYDDTDPQGYDPATDLDPEATDQRQMLMALLQFALPGAPTIYYGDEAGVYSPGGWYNDKWEDDPYNRVPFPWGDIPGYYEQRSDVLALYSQLGRIRSQHPALRTGTFDTLLTDDGNAVYAFGRTLGVTETAVVVVNRGTTAQTVTVPLTGYVPDATQLTDHLNRAYHTVSGGEITLTVAPEWGAILSTTPERWIYLPLVMRVG